MSAPTRRRRPRTVFHYKVDEDLKPQDREPYLALLHAPRTRVDDAHRWLVERGYVLSRSAVARHRRRLLAAEADREAAVARCATVARLAAKTNAADFTAGVEAYWKHLVFERLLEAGGNTLRSETSDVDAAGGSSVDPTEVPDKPPLTPRELLDLGKLVDQCIEMTHRRLQRRAGADTPANDDGARLPQPRSDAELRKHFEDILFHGK